MNYLSQRANSYIGALVITIVGSFAAMAIITVANADPIAVVHASGNIDVTTLY
jgi:hypothetical protein